MEETTFGKETAWLVTCPVCDWGFNHHHKVEVFHREHEDWPSLKLIPGHSIPRIAEENENPSPRRHAVRIWFEGECGHSWHLDIVQHKGWTFLIPRDSKQED